MADITKNDYAFDPTSTQRDPSKNEHDQLRPRSLRSSGAELDAGCEITQASGGLGLDEALKLIEKETK
jgi:hypothetical protein